MKRTEVQIDQTDTDIQQLKDENETEGPLARQIDHNERVAPNSLLTHNTSNGACKQQFCHPKVK